MLAALRRVPFDKAYYYSALTFAFTMPLSRAAISFFIVWFVLLWLVEGNFRQKFEQLNQSVLLKAMGIFILLNVFSVLWSSDTKTALNIARLFSYWLVIPVLATSLKKEWIKPVITSFLYGMLISEILAYGIYFDIWSINNRPPSYPSPFMQHIDYSIYLAFTAVLLINRLFSKYYLLQEKALMLLFFLTVTGNLFLSTGRTGQVAFLIAIFVSILIHYRLTLKSFLLFGLISMTLFVGAYFALPIFQKRVHLAQQDIEKFSNNNYNSSWGLRAAFWIVTYDIVKSDPLLGVGAGDYKLATQTALKKNDHGLGKNVIRWCNSNHFHNQYLMIIVQTGLIGFALLIYMLITFYRLKIDNRELKELSILFTTIYAISFIAEPLFIKQFTLALFVLFSGLFIGATFKEDEQRAL